MEAHCNTKADFILFADICEISNPIIDEPAVNRAPCSTTVSSMLVPGCLWPAVSTEHIAVSYVQMEARLNSEEEFLNRFDAIDKNIKNLVAACAHLHGAEGIGKKHDSWMSAKLDAIDQKLDSLLLSKVSSSIESKINAIDNQIASIYELLSSDRENESNNSERNENIFQEDRKRLKERLIAAVDHKDSTGAITSDISWIEKIFGIRPADGRLGKERSRYQYHRIAKLNFAFCVNILL